MDRFWAMPSKYTFEIKPIRELLMQYMPNGLVIDPFANKSKLASVTNDLDTSYDTDFHLDATDFLAMFQDASVAVSYTHLKGGGIWGVMLNINDALKAIGLGLLVLFFAVGVVKTLSLIHISPSSGCRRRSSPPWWSRVLLRWPFPISCPRGCRRSMSPSSVPFM